VEYLKIFDNGQWELKKVYGDPPKTADAPSNKPFKSYSTATATGQLRVDRGTQGELHNFNGGAHPKPAGVESARHWGKPAHNEDSEYADQFPGSGE
jgi:hypothetical protein